MADYLKCGALPRQIALEVIDSIRDVLLPLPDTTSRGILRSLTIRKKFDTECLRIEQSSIRRDEEENISYVCFSARLADLYEEMENSTSRGRGEIWLQRRSGARYVMLATLIGMIFAVILAMASFGCIIVSCVYRTEIRPGNTQSMALREWAMFLNCGKHDQCVVECTVNSLATQYLRLPSMRKTVVIGNDSRIVPRRRYSYMTFVRCCLGQDGMRAQLIGASKSTSTPLRWKS